MYRVYITGVPEGSEWDLWPSGFPTEDEATDFFLGLGRTLVASLRSGESLPQALSISTTGPNGYFRESDLKTALGAGYLLPAEDE